MSQFSTSKWWKPGKPERSLPGVLFKDDKGRWLLQLEGMFEDLPAAVVGPSGVAVGKAFAVPDDFPILVGVTAGNRFVTAFDCQLVGSGLPLFSAGGHLELCPRLLAYDVHFDSLEDFSLTSLSLRFSDLDGWAATSGFVVQYPSDSLYPVDVSYSLPEPLEVDLEDGVTIGLGFSVSGPTIPAQSELHIVQRAWVTVSSETGRPYEELVRLATGFSDLVALAVGQPVRPLEMAATCNAFGEEPGVLKKVRVELIHNASPIAPELPDVDSWNMLFTLVDVRESFSSIVRAWFTRGEALRPLYDLYFATLRSPGYVEHRFLNMFQALEAFDRRARVPDPEKLRRNQDRIKRVLNPEATKKDRKWLEDKLRHSGEPTAMERIKDLVKEHEAAWLLDDEAVGLAADFRNFYTHYDASVEKRLPPKADRPRCMHNLAVRLQVLCEIVLLDLLGFPGVRQQIEKSRRLRRRLIA